MVTLSLVTTKWGFMLEPPYSEEEQTDLYRRMSKVVAFIGISPRSSVYTSTSEQLSPDGQLPAKEPQKGL